MKPSPVTEAGPALARSGTKEASSTWPVVVSAGRMIVELVLRLVPAQYLLRRSAEKLGVAAIGVRGELGFFQGSARDEVVHAAYLRDRTWAPELQALFRRVLERGGGTLIDVGANIGLTCIPVAKALGIRCYAFEPDPDNFTYLVSNIAANGASTVKPFNVAVSPRAGALRLERSNTNMGDHRIRVGAESPGAYSEQDRTTVEVQGARLDAVLEAEVITSPVLLKVDTQGAEVQVLRSAAALLPRVDCAVLEFWPYGLRRMGDSPDAFYELISGFAFGAVLSGGAVPALRPIEECIAELRRRLPQDGSSIDHADVLVSRTATI